MERSLGPIQFEVKRPNSAFFALPPRPGHILKFFKWSSAFTANIFEDMTGGHLGVVKGEEILTVQPGTAMSPRQNAYCK
jgi:hypothetical protein